MHGADSGRFRQHTRYKICFILDGLDEFEGNRLDHEKLASKFKDWTVESDVKLLVSSRPWMDFLNIFDMTSTIHLHELNHLDIKTYGLGKVENDREVCW